MGMLKDSGMIVIATIIANLFAFVFHLYVGRVLGVSDYGVFGALLALYLIFALPAGAIGNAITKYAAKYNSRSEYEKIGTLRKIISKRVWVLSIIIFLIIVALSGFIANYLKINSFIPVIFIGFNIIFAMILPVNRGILQGMKKFKVYSINTVIEAFSRLVLVAVLLLFGMGVNGAVLAYGLGYLIAYLLIFPYIKETYNNKPERLEMKPIYRYILIVLIVSFILQLMINIPSVFIKHFLGSEFTGYWTAALSISRLVIFVSAAVSTVMFPEVAGAESKIEKRKILRKSLLLTLFFSAIVAVAFMALPGLAIGILYGAEYVKGASPILFWMQPFMVAFGILQLCVSYWLAELEEKKKES